MYCVGVKLFRMLAQLESRLLLSRNHAYLRPEAAMCWSPKQVF